MKLTVNGTEQTLDKDGDMPILWYVRDLRGFRERNLDAASAFAGPASCISMVLPCVVALPLSKRRTARTSRQSKR